MNDELPLPEIHHQAIVLDGHSDVPIDVVKRRRAGERAVLFTHHLPSWRAGGANGAILTVAGDEMQPEKESPLVYALKAAEAVRADIEEHAENMTFVTTADALVAAVESERFAIALNVEGSRPLGGEIDNLYRLYEAGVRFMTLTWNYRNEVGAGAAYGDQDGGLTSFGRNVVRTMADLGMVTDLSHASPRTFWDAIALESGNLIVSHSNASALKPHVRNIDDEQLRAIAAQGGYVGVCFYPGFLQASAPDVTDVVDQIEYIANVAGSDHVALGPDYIDYALEEIVAHIRASSVNYGDNFVYPAGLETVSSLGNLTREMLRRGFDEAFMAKVLGDNILRLFRRVCGV